MKNIILMVDVYFLAFGIAVFFSLLILSLSGCASVERPYINPCRLVVGQNPNMRW